jgi:MFS family permease
MHVRHTLTSCFQICSAMAVVGGPCLGPIVSAAFVANPSLGWRWTEYFTGILQAIILVIDVVFIDECYPPKLLVYKARRLRHETGNWALHTKFEEWDVSIKELSKKFLLRPIQLLMTPICFLVALYASFCYGILYMQLGESRAYELYARNALTLYLLFCRWNSDYLWGNERLASCKRDTAIPGHLSRRNNRLQHQCL